MADDLSLAEVCALAEVGRHTVYRWRRMGLLPTPRYWNDGKGSGTRATFPGDETRAAIARIKKARKRGVSLRELAKDGTSDD